MTGAVVAEVTIAGQALSIAAMVRITAVPDRQIVDQVQSIVDRAVAGTIAGRAVETTIVWAMSVMYVRKTGRPIVEKIGKWIAERTAGLILAGNFVVSTVPIAWQVSMGERGAMMPGWFRWIGPTVRSELSLTRDRRGRNERDGRDGTEQNSYTK